MSTAADIVLPESLLLGLAGEGPIGGTWRWEEPHSHLRIRSERPVTHAEPAALACLAAWSTHLRSRGVTLHIDDSLKSPYLWRTGLLSALAGRPSAGIPQEDYLPPTRITSQEERPELFRRLTPILRLQDDNQRAVVLKCVGEILNNVHEHSNSESGAFVCCSYFPQSDRVSLAVADTGNGVPSDIRRKHGMDLTDTQALNAAIQWRVSGASATQDNAGIGLFYVRSAAINTGGQFVLLSGSGQIRSTRPEEEEVAQLATPWRGTLVAVSFRPSQAQKVWAQTEALLAADLDNRKSQPVQWTPPPPDARQVEITPAAAGLVEDKSQARRIRDELLLPEVTAGRPVCIKLSEVRLITHSFVHTLFYAAFRQLGNRSRELIYVQAREPRVKDMIRIVARYAREAEEST